MSEARPANEGQRRELAAVPAARNQATGGGGSPLGEVDWDKGAYRDHLVKALAGHPELQDRVRRLPAGGPYHTLEAVLKVLPPAREEAVTAESGAVTTETDHVPAVAEGAFDGTQVMESGLQGTEAAEASGVADSSAYEETTGIVEAPTEGRATEAVGTTAEMSTEPAAALSESWFVSASEKTGAYEPTDASVQTGGAVTADATPTTEAVTAADVTEQPDPMATAKAADTFGGEVPGLTEEDMDVLPDEHDEALAENEVALSITEEDMDLQPETAAERARVAASPMTDETAEDLSDGRSEAFPPHDEENELGEDEEDEVEEARAEHDEDAEQARSEGGIRGVIENVAEALDDLEDRVDDLVKAGVTASVGRIAGRERAEKVWEQLDELEDRVEDTVEEAAERVQETAEVVFSRVGVAVGGGNPVQRAAALGLFVAIVSGLLRWIVRRVFRADLAWLGPKEIKPAVLGIGIASVVASGYMGERAESEPGEDDEG